MRQLRVGDIVLVTRDKEQVPGVALGKDREGRQEFAIIGSVAVYESRFCSCHHKTVERLSWEAYWQFLDEVERPVLWEG